MPTSGLNYTCPDVYSVDNYRRFFDSLMRTPERCPGSYVISAKSLQKLWQVFVRKLELCSIVGDNRIAKTWELLTIKEKKKNRLQLIILTHWRSTWEVPETPQRRRERFLGEKRVFVSKKRDVMASDNRQKINAAANVGKQARVDKKQNLSKLTVKLFT